MTVYTELEGLQDAELYFRSAPAFAKKAARMAINQVVQRSGMKLLTDEMYDQVSFPQGYLKGERIKVSRLATDSNLEAGIIARKRATSLARFAAAGTPLGTKTKAGVTVTVRNGKTIHLRNAWLVRLNKGASKTEDQFNIGLAVYVKPGDRVTGKSSAHQSWLNAEHTVALLYGPSVDQVFNSVADNQGKRILNLVGDEFFRQFERLTS